MKRKTSKISIRYILLLVLALAILNGCARMETRPMEVTAYCGCGTCCGYKEGLCSRIIPFYDNRRVAQGPRAGQPYTGHTASGKKPHQYQPGLISLDSLRHPWKIPLRIIIFPRILPRRGTVAADTAYYPFGTKLDIPGYGRGIVEDCGGAIKGPNRLDVFYRSHKNALKWGRRQVNVRVAKPD